MSISLYLSKQKPIWIYRGSFPQKQSPIYFNRREVKEAIHAPIDTRWTECSNVNVFPNGDQSLPPAFTVLPSVIEKNVRTVIVHGLADFILIAEGYVFPIVLPCRVPRPWLLMREKHGRLLLGRVS